MRKNFFFQLSYQILTIIIPLITTPYVSRVLGAEAIGNYSYSYSVVSYFSLFILLGIANYGNRTIATVRDEPKRLSVTFFELYAVQLLASIIVVTAYSLYTYVVDNSIMNWIMLLYLFSVVLDISWFYFGIEQFKVTVARNTIVKIISTIAIFGFVKSNQDLYLYSVILTGSFLINNLFLWVFLPRYISWQGMTYKGIVQHILPNLTLFLSVLAISFYTTLPKIMLGNIGTVREVGFYSSVERIMSLPIAIVNALGIVMLPRVSNLLANNKQGQVHTLLSKSILLSSFLVVPLAFGVMGVADVFVPWFFGVGFEKCIMLLKIMMPSCFFLAIGSIIRTQYLIPYKKDAIYIESVVLGALCNAFLNQLLLPNLLAIGAAISALLSQMTVCIWQIWRIRREIELASMVSSVVFVGIGLLMYFLLIGLPNTFPTPLYNLLYKTFIGGVIYMVLSTFYYFKHLKT